MQHALCRLCCDLACFAKQGRPPHPPTTAHPSAPATLLMAQRSWPVWFIRGCVMLSSMLSVASGICGQGSEAAGGCGAAQHSRSPATRAMAMHHVLSNRQLQIVRHPPTGQLDTLRLAHRAHGLLQESSSLIAGIADLQKWGHASMCISNKRGMDSRGPFAPNFPESSTHQHHSPAAGRSWRRSWPPAQTSMAARCPAAASLWSASSHWRPCSGARRSLQGKRESTRRSGHSRRHMTRVWQTFADANLHRSNSAPCGRLAR